jgi:Zn-dependent protease
MANLRGDPTGRLMGRMTLNPLAHIDPMGTVILPLIMMITNVPFMFGWAKPVPFNPLNLRNMRRDPVWIALAGPGSNLIIALLAAIAMRVTVSVLHFETVGALVSSPVFSIIKMMFMVNLGLMVFNCLPVPPLDGSHVLYYFLPEGGKRVFEQIGPYGILAVLFISQMTNLLDVPFALALKGIAWVAFLGAGN